MTDDLTRRVSAVERAVSGGATDLADVSDAATLDSRLTAVETRLDELATRVEELDATTQALRGYLGGVDEISADVERRADLALAKAEELEAAVFTDDGLAVERLPTTDEKTGTAEETQRTPTGGGQSVPRTDSRSAGIREHGTPSSSRERATPNGDGAPARSSSRRGTDRGADRSLVARLRDAL